MEVMGGETHAQRVLKKSGCAALVLTRMFKVKVNTTKYIFHFEHAKRQKTYTYKYVQYNSSQTHKNQNIHAVNSIQFKIIYSTGE